MPNQFFQFKQFIIKQDKAAMKVGTDGVLLGSWKIENKPKLILDIGSGTGLLSLMMAQKFPEAEIHAIDVDQKAVLQTQENIQDNLPLSKNIHCFYSSLQTWNFKEKYGLIICNPPYFEVSNQSNTSRNIARQGVLLSLEELFENVSLKLSENGLFHLILPAENFQKVKTIALHNNLYLNKIMRIKPKPEKPAKRILLSFSKNTTQIKEEEMIIEENGRHQYSEAYRNQTKDYYL